jgi:hypothetical protein
MDTARATPFDVEVVSSKTDGDQRTEQCYLSSKPTAGRAADRVFFTFSRVVKPGASSPVYLNLSAGGTIDEAAWLARHLDCAVVDIEWRRNELPKRSQWAGVNPANPWLVTPAVTDCFLYAVAMGFRRVLDYVAAQPEIDARHVGCGGGSFGGWFALLLAGVDHRISSVYDLYASGGRGERRGWHTLNVAAMPPDQRAAFLNSYDPCTFAANNQAASLMVLGTNDYSFWLDDALYHYDLLPGNKRLVLYPNFNHNAAAFGYAAPDDWVPWSATTLRDGPAFPTVEEPVPHGDAYTIRAAGPLPIGRAQLMWSAGAAGAPKWPARYWLTVEARRDGEGWTAVIPSPFASLRGLVYATVFDAAGRAVSSRLVARDGVDPAAGQALWRDGALWDVERGPGAWRVPGGGKRYGLSAAKVEAFEADGLKITPAPDGKFFLVTDSVGLSRPLADHHHGLRLVIDGQGQAGRLRLSLDREAGTADEASLVQEFAYGPATMTVDLPWSAFGAGLPAYDALRLEGTRTDGAALILRRIAFLD